MLYFILNLRQITSLDMALFINRGHYLSVSTVIAELTQVDSLPGAQVQFAVCYRNGKATPKREHLACAGISSGPSIVCS